MILMLEDNTERVDRFRATLQAIDSSLQLLAWNSAWAMIREIEPHLESACLISLDHDLEPIDGEANDPGDGMDVAKFLASHTAMCPVIIHSSNTDRSLWMSGEFELAGWQYYRVAPIGDDWIESDWSGVVRRILKKSRLISRSR